VSAITGFVRRSGRAEHETACRSMLAELVPYGRHSQDCRSLGDACFGRALDAVLPEDDFDRQPLTGGGGRYLLAADVRIDNRAEVAERLGVATARLKALSDADLLLAAWEKWQLGCFEHLLGEIALAVWDADDKRLTLARSPNCLKPLFFHRGADFVAFASMPSALLGLADARYAMKQYDTAEEAYRGALQSDPKLAAAANGLARLLHSVTRNLKEAERQYRKAVELAPASGLYRANLGLCLLHQERKSEAETEARAAIELGYRGPHPLFDRLEIRP
jgi:asparagine synthetase B (glutamine-hydrolysing)